MNEYILESHLQTHKLIMEEVRKLVPAKKMFDNREFSLSQVIVNEDDSLVAEYSRYIGCGDYDRETDYLDPSKLFDSHNI